MSNKKHSKNGKKFNHQSISVTSEVQSLLNDPKVHKDRIVVLAELYILHLYCQGVKKENIHNLAIINGMFFKNILMNYRPKLMDRISENQYRRMFEDFCDGLKALTRALFISCYRFDGVGIDIETLQKVVMVLQNETMV